MKRRLRWAWMFVYLTVDSVASAVRRNLPV